LSLYSLITLVPSTTLFRSPHSITCMEPVTERTAPKNCSFTRASFAGGSVARRRPSRQPGYQIVGPTRRPTTSLLEVALVDGWTSDRKSTRLNSSHVKISYA